MTDTLTQRARDAAGRLKRREIRGEGMVIAWLPPSSEAIAEAAAIISELVERIEGVWQPIETAPKDGTWILLCGGRTDEDFYLRDEPEAQSRIVSAFWLLSPCGDEDGEEWSVGFWDGSWRTGYENPTHWMPLPPPPSVLGKQEGEG